MISYLSAQAASGVVGPSTWRIGNMRVVSLGRSNAVVTACSYDPGSHFRSGDLAAPAALGGGAGLPAYITDMAEMKGSWKLERSVTSAEQSSSSPVLVPALGEPCDHRACPQFRPRPRRRSRRERRRSGLDRLVHLVLGVVARQSSGPRALHRRCRRWPRTVRLARHRVFVEQPQRGSGRRRTSGQLLDATAGWWLSRDLVGRSLGRLALETGRIVGSFRPCGLPETRAGAPNRGRRRV